jgi:hypothetical protein
MESILYCTEENARGRTTETLYCKIKIPLGITRTLLTLKLNSSLVEVFPEDTGQKKNLRKFAVLDKKCKRIRLKMYDVFLLHCYERMSLCFVLIYKNIG